MSEESKNMLSPPHRNDTNEEEKQTKVMPPSIKPRSGADGFNFFKENDSLEKQSDMNQKNLMRKSVEMSIKNQPNRFIGRKQMF